MAEEKSYIARCMELRSSFFELHGMSIAEWARQNDFLPQRVYDVLSGRNRGMSGEARRVAERLGLIKTTGVAA